VKPPQIVCALGVLPALGLLGLYLSGCVYFALNHASIEAVTPLTFVEHWRYYHGNARYQHTLNLAAMLGFGISVVAPLFALLALTQKKETLHGAARWAAAREILHQYKLTKPQDDGKGLLLGRLGKRFLYYTGPAFVFLAAATRTGKGIGIIIPNLLRWFDSCVVTDFKIENFAITSKFRQKVLRQAVYLFNPFDESGKTHRYNPLGYVRAGHLTIPDLLTIAEILFPTDVGDSTAKYFASSAQSLFLGLALYVKQTPTLPFTLGEIYRQASGKGKALKVHLTEILEKRKDLCKHSQQALTGFLSLDEDKGQSGVSNTVKTALQDWSNPIFDAATSTNDFDLRALRKKRMTIYIGVTPDYIPVSGRILNLFFSQLISLNTQTLPERDLSLKHKVLLLMDEFTAMGRSGIIAKSNSYFAGYGLQLLTVVQNPAQLKAREPEGYGDNIAKTLLSNHEVQLVYTPEKEDAEEISRFLGDKTVKVESVQRTSGKIGRTITTSEQRRPLMLPQELREMPFEKLIIMMRGKKPIHGDKIHYYQESPFIDRLKALSPSLAPIKGYPSKAQLDIAMAAGELQITVPPVAQDAAQPNSVFASPLDNPTDTVEPQNQDSKQPLTDPAALASLAEREYDPADIPAF